GRAAAPSSPRPPAEPRRRRASVRARAGRAAPPPRLRPHACPPGRAAARGATRAPDRAAVAS
ncbi:MAG: hypothetical protein D6689_03230, partial [Deltaproteobacteria bacterium]